MSRRKWLWSVPVAGAVGLGVGADRWLNAAADKDDLKPAAALPVTKVVLFSSGVGYFGRSGEVEGDARVDLRFPETSVHASADQHGPVRERRHCMLRPGDAHRSWSKRKGVCDRVV